jgi:hypothetical protein
MDALRHPNPSVRLRHDPAVLLLDDVAILPLGAAAA